MVVDGHVLTKSEVAKLMKLACFSDSEFMEHQDSGRLVKTKKKKKSKPLTSPVKATKKISKLTAAKRAKKTPKQAAAAKPAKQTPIPAFTVEPVSPIKSVAPASKKRKNDENAPAAKKRRKGAPGPSKNTESEDEEDQDELTLESAREDIRVLSEIEAALSSGTNKENKEAAAEAPLLGISAFAMEQQRRSAAAAAKRRAKGVDAETQKKERAAKRAEKLKKKGQLREIIIDGSNVAMGCNLGKRFNEKGIKLCLDYFLKRGHKVKVFVPQHKRANRYPLLEKWHKRGVVVFTPSRQIGDKSYTPYDDRYILSYATACKGIVVSQDQFRDLYHEKPMYRETIEKRLLVPTFVGDYVLFPPDPLGRNGPTLNSFLKF